MLSARHRLRTNLFAQKGIYLYSESATPSVWMFDMISRTVMMVAHFKAYPAEFPLRDPTCLVSASGTSEDVQAMHAEDEIDDADIGTPLDPSMTRSRALQLPVTSTRIPHRNTRTSATTATALHFLPACCVWVCRNRNWQLLFLITM